MADTFDLTVRQGERLVVDGVYDNGATPPVGIALPGAIRWQVRREDSVDAALVFDFSAYVTPDAVVVGGFHLDVPGAITRTIPVGGGHHDAFAGNEVKLFKGTVVVEPATTV